MSNNVNRPPAGMPAQPPRPDGNALRGRAVQPPPMPEQKPVTDEEQEERKSSLAGRILRHIGLALLLIIALVFAYIFLLLGEPEEDAKYVQKPAEETITMPMSALDIPGESDPARLAESFGEPVLALNQMLTMYKSRIYDTAFEGEYARCVTITYTFEDGQTLLAESLRPTSAVTLLKKDGYTLDASALYTMGGLNAARMQNESTVCVFAQSDTAVYAITCPVSHAEELANLLRYTTLIAPTEGE